MPYLVLASQLAFQKTKDDDVRVPDGPEEVVKRGNAVPDYAPTFLISALESAGLIVYAEGRRADLVPADELAPQVRTPDQPPVLPSDPNGTPPLLVDLSDPANTTTAPVVDVEPAVEPAPAVAPLGQLPKQSESKEVWEAYAQHPRIGLTAGEAESMNKSDLVAEVRKRYDAAQ